MVVERNWRCRLGELDLICRSPTGAIVFVEVKTRSGDGYGEPIEAVTPAKLRKLRLLATEWLSQCRFPVSVVQFDVIGVLWGPSGPRVEHVERVV